MNDEAACPNAAGTGPEEAGGPLQEPGGGLTYGMNYIEPGTLRDATVIPLDNPAATPVLITGVDVVPDPGTSPLAFAGAFVTSSPAYLEIKPARDRRDYQPAAGFCLAPSRDVDPPVLVVRIGPSVTPGSARFSRNNAVNVHYTTTDGRRYVAAYPYRFEYPNHR